MAQYGFDAADIALLDKFEFGFSCEGDIPADKVEIIKATLDDYIATEKIDGKSAEADVALAEAILKKM